MRRLSAASVKMRRKLSTELSWKLAMMEWQWPSISGMALRSKALRGVTTYFLFFAGPTA
jgi:hypothetical protein